MSVLFSSALPINGNFPAVVQGTGTAIKYFPASSSLAAAIAPNILANSNGIIVVPGLNAVNGTIVTVRAAGSFSIGNNSPAASPAVTIGLYPVTFNGLLPVIGATAVASQTITGASDLITTNQPWALELDLAGDNDSGLVQLVRGDIQMDGTTGTVTKGLVTGLSGINFAAQAQQGVQGISAAFPYGLVVGVTFSVSDANAIAKMYQFGLTY